MMVCSWSTMGQAGSCSQVIDDPASGRLRRGATLLTGSETDASGRSSNMQSARRVFGRQVGCARTRFSLRAALDAGWLETASSRPTSVGAELSNRGCAG